MDRLASFEVFVSVVDRGGLTSAADAMDMSPSMVAKHLRDIESRLGVRLFNRTTRRQSLTDPGRVFYSHCKALLEHVKEAESDIKALLKEPQGQLRIFAPVTYGVYCLAPLISQYSAQFPTVQVDLALSDGDPLLLEDGFDAAIAIGRIEDSRYVVRELSPYTMALGASPSYLKAHGVPAHPNDLRTHNCLCFSHWDRQDSWHLIGPTGEYRIPVTGNIRVNNGAALVQAAMLGAGVVLQPEAIMRGALNSGCLIRVLPDYAPPSRPTSLLYLPDRRMTPKLRAFIDLLMADVGESRQQR